MVILFLVALLLAWPTAGISIIAYIAFAVFKSYLNAKTRIHYANERCAEREVFSGARHVPSWAGDNDENQIFVEFIQKGAMRKGVPQTFICAVLGDTDTFRDLVYLAGAMERQGASFVEQQIAVSEKLVQIWEQAPAKVRAAALSSLALPLNNKTTEIKVENILRREKDHAPAITKAVANLILNNQKIGVLPWLSIKEAIQYAYTQENYPVIDSNETMVQCHATIDDTDYNLCFEQHPEKGVYIYPNKCI